VTARWRLVDDLDVPRDAAAQMAADLACLDEVAAGGEPVLRLYAWSPPALSLGRFQPETDVDAVRCAELGIEVVRRPTGGKALLHGADVTYAVALTRPAGPAGHVDAVYRTIAAGLVAGLASLGVAATVGEERGPAGPVCFAAAQGADLRVGDRKLCGSAQVQRGDAVLQHGSVLLDRLPYDEIDLLAGAPPEPGERDRIRAKRVTLHDLGVDADPETVGAAIVSGFETALDVTFASRVTP
jgi:lipoyl(octanoyl) transferase